MRLQNRIFVAIVCILFTLSPEQSQAQTEKPSAKDLIVGWKQEVDRLKDRLHSYQVNGHFIRKLEGEDGRNTTTTRLRWRAVRADQKYLWDITTGEFEWNPRIEPETKREAISFDGKSRHHLAKDPTSKFDQDREKFVVPEGSVLSVEYERSHRGRLVEPMSLDDLRKRKPIVFTGYTSAEDTPEVNFRTSPCYPLEPYDIFCDPFNQGDTSGSGSIVAHYLKNLPFLTTVESTPINGHPSIRVVLPDKKAVAKIWIPRSIIFSLYGKKWLPTRFESETGTPSKPKTGTSVVAYAMVEVKEYCDSADAVWPCVTRTDSKAVKLDTNKTLALMTIDKEIRVTRINDHFSEQELILQEPTYAVVNQDGHMRKKEPVPARIDMRPTTFIYCGLFAIVLIVFTTAKLKTR